MFLRVGCRSELRIDVFYVQLGFSWCYYRFLSICVHVLIASVGVSGVCVCVCVCVESGLGCVHFK